MSLSLLSSSSELVSLNQRRAAVFSVFQTGHLLEVISCGSWQAGQVGEVVVQSSFL